MAKGLMNVGIPIDEPISIRPGVAYREVDWHGSMLRYSVPPENPDKARAGDLSMSYIKNFMPKSSVESPGIPFANMRKYKGGI